MRNSSGVSQNRAWSSPGQSQYVRISARLLSSCPARGRDPRAVLL